MRFVDLFAGIGGFRQAASRLRIQGVKMKPIAFAELDPACRSLYRQAYSVEGEQEVCDVHNIASRNARLATGQTRLPDFDLLVAGFPCQAFSNVGHRFGLDDPRGRLYSEIVRLLSSYRPRFFVLENVQKVATLSNGDVLRTIIADLENAGYHVHVWDLCAHHYGLPQQRRRLFFCGVDKQYARAKLSLEAPPRRALRYPTAWHALEKAMPDAHLVPPKTRATVLRRNPKWMGDLRIDRAVARPICASMSKWHRANQDNYYSATYVAESNTDPTRPPEVDLEREPIRRITPMEGFRLQGFPDHFAWLCERDGLTFTPIYRMIGNAVPVDLANAVMSHFLRSYLGLVGPTGGDP